MAIVSVSREEGSWGGDVARDLATRLGYRLLDKKALLEEAEAYGGIRDGSPELLEKQPGLLERLDQDRRRYNVLLRTVVGSEGRSRSARASRSQRRSRSAGAAGLKGRPGDSGSAGP